MIGALLTGLALAGPGAAETEDPRLEEAVRALEDGDAAWFAGRRGRGARAWRRALRKADGTTPLARSVRIRARVRLLRAGTNWTPIQRLGGMNKDVAACPGEDVWCQLAYVDIYLLAPSRVFGQDLDVARRGLEALEEALPEEVAARRTLLLGTPPPELGEDPVGLARAVQEPPPDTLQPGLAVVAPGLLADPAMGVGGTLGLTLPDAFRRRFEVSLTSGVATHGGFGLLQVVTPQGEGPWRVVLSASGMRTRWWDGEDWAPVAAGRFEVGPVWREGPVWVQARPRLRWDADLGDPAHPRPGHEVWLEGGVDGRKPVDGKAHVYRGVRVSLGGEGTIPEVASYDRVGGLFEVFGGVPAGEGQIAARLRVQGAWGPDQPTSRVPWLGGPDVFRGAPFGALDGDVVGVLGAEIRHPVWQVIWVASFADLGVTPDGVWPGGGLGLRMVPPQGLGGTVVRFDVAASELGFQLQVGLAEAF